MFTSEFWGLENWMYEVLCRYPLQTLPGRSAHPTRLREAPLHLLTRQWLDPHLTAHNRTTPTVWFTRWTEWRGHFRWWNSICKDTGRKGTTWTHMPPSWVCHHAHHLQGYAVVFECPSFQCLSHKRVKKPPKNNEEESVGEERAPIL